MYFEFVPFRDFFLRMSLKRNQVLKLAPTEVLFTPRAFFLLFPLARSVHRKHTFSNCLEKASLLHSALVQVPNFTRSNSFENTDRLDIKKPESLSGGLGIPPQTCALPGLGLLSLNRLLSLLDV